MTDKNRSTVHDDIQSVGFFPDLYDGRALIGKSYTDYANGVKVDDLVAQHNKAKAAGDESRSIQFA